MKSVFIGFDTRLSIPYMVAHKSLSENCTDDEIRILPVLLPWLYGSGLYNRPMKKDSSGLYDERSEHHMSTEFAISRFLVPYLAGYGGWSVFCDSDFLFLDDIAKVFDLADDRYAVMVVKHDYNPDQDIKMDGQRQSRYNRKNWSSFILFNNEHPANQLLTPELVNSLPGRKLHQFSWLKDEEIGELPMGWNFLEGYNKETEVENIHAIHYTHGTPDMPGKDNSIMAHLWQHYAKDIRICVSAS